MRFITALYLFLYSLFLNANSIDSNLFGKNQTLIKILQNNYHLSQKEFLAKKNSYLQDLKRKKSFNGLYFKLNSEKILTHDKNSNYSFRVEWDLYEDGYYNNQKKLKKTLLQEDIRYDEVLNSYKNSTLTLSLFELESIKNFIQWYFLQKENGILAKQLQLAQKKYKSSLITKDELFFIKRKYLKNSQLLEYFNSVEKKPFDISIQNLVLNLDEIKLISPEYLINHALSNSFELKKIKKQANLLKYQNSIDDNKRVNLYIENRKFFYTKDADTIAGVELKIPIAFDKNRQSRIQKQLYTLKKQTIKNNISVKIKKIYQKIDLAKSDIKAMKKEIYFLDQKLLSFDIKSKYPLLKDSSSLDKKTSILISVNNLQQEIWQKRLEILKELIKLQYLSTVKIF